MDEPQEVSELPAKKARHEPEVRQSKGLRDAGTADSAGGNHPAVLGSDVTSYPPSALAHLDGGASDGSSQESGTGSSADPEFTSQLYQANNPAVTAYSSQVAFSPLGQSSIYNTFPQAGQNYGLPPFGSCFTTSSVYANIPAANATAATTTAATGTQQEFSAYNSLGQNQFAQYYVSPSYLPGRVPGADGDATGATAAGYPATKTEGSVPAGVPSTADTSPAVNLPTVPTGGALPTGARDPDEAARRNPTSKAKGKAKKSESTQPTDNDLERIFLWDLDETIIIFHSLLTGTFAQKFGKDPATVLNLGLQMEELIFELADTHLFFNDLEECDQVHIEDVASDDNGQDLGNYNFASDGFSGPSGGGGAAPTPAVQGGVEWMRKLAFRYRRLREIYNGYKNNVGGLLSPMKRELLVRLQSEIETVTDCWLSTALKSLLLIQSRGRCMNILVTTTQLVPALAKVLLYGLGDVFPIENIYSATKIGKESCFERIISRFGKKVTYVVIGDGRDEEFAAKQHNMPFWRISTHGDLVSLHQALELDFL
ncbi:protein phosphatase EYA3 isoform X2 [Denticeps clupeoides]|uniref:protein phosphatase EYA3 isoform X2 n=1 Tax=Denticeps clupeoides TaxID=299321 RepID=UPI0010A30CC3|nr:eyes absent homolog 3 isoform X2 [Denticeps clupeoides]